MGGSACCPSGKPTSDAVLLGCVLNICWCVKQHARLAWESQCQLQAVALHSGASKLRFASACLSRPAAHPRFLWHDPVCRSKSLLCVYSSQLHPGTQLVIPSSFCIGSNTSLCNMMTHPTLLVVQRVSTYLCVIPWSSGSGLEARTITFG